MLEWENFVIVKSGLLKNFKGPLKIQAILKKIQ